MEIVITTLIALVIGGAFGGAVAALSNLTPRSDANTDAQSLDWLTNIVFGAVAGVVSQVNTMRTANNAADVAIGAVMALGVGLGGAKWVRDRLDKGDLKKATAELAAKPPNADAAKAISATSSARKVLQIARELPG